MLHLVAALTLFHMAGAPAPPALATGDGRLMAGIDARGRLVQYRWPSPGYWEHIRPPATESGAHYGGGWLVEEDGEWSPFPPAHGEFRLGYTAPNTLVLTTHWEEPKGRRSIDQRIFVWPGKDVLVLEARLHGFDPDTRIAWRQDFSPATHVPTGSAHGDLAVAAADFAAYVDPEERALIQFRPSAPGREAWERAHALVRGEAAPDEFGEGVYLYTSIAPAPRAAVVGEEGAVAPGRGEVAASGRVGGVLTVAPSPAGEIQTAVVYIGAGETRAQARDAVATARAAGFPALLRDAEDAGREWLQGAPRWTPEAVVARDVLNLLLCIDRGTGTVLRAPVAQPAQAYASITDTVWAAAALDRLGYTDAAGRALSRFLDAVRTTADDGFPAGSLPAHILCDGRPARFDAAADPASAAWLLAACWRHAQALPGGGAVAYLRQHWPVLSACADFLAFAPGPGRTLAGGTLLPDGSTAMLDTHFLGLECARRIALALGQAEPTPWGDRWSELYTRIRARGLDATSGPPAGDTWVAHWVATLGDGATEDRGWEILLRGEAAPPDTSRPETPELPNARLHALRCLQAFP